MAMMTAPGAPPSAVLCLTLTLGVFRPSANGLFLPHGQPPGYPSAPGSGGASRGAELSLLKVRSQRGGGCGLGLVVISPAASTSFTHHMFPRCRSELHGNGDVDRRLQASTNGNSTGDRECLTDCMSLQSLYQCKPAVKRA